MNAPQDPNLAAENAKAAYENIVSMVAAMNIDWCRLNELREERDNADDPAQWVTDCPTEAEELAELEAAAGDYADADEAREAIQDDALSVEIRSGWVTPGEEMRAEEFSILLTTGGPALRMRGELDEHMQPRRAWLEMQDWFTPWTQYHGDGGTSVAQDVLLAYAGVFYFGE